ncbi:MAG: hypothetical protein DI598_06110 [Pseudopedobacter saltans]|uniref:Uncharacterized protein n=1 Tax=Pseudopedobacter saltans TaxID=151895 RepID=A0A2W5H3I1_9SPHI|nr:MAG: hypothetical protein DI598_06110 [Pseudopedobacter saltans]
MNAKPERKDRAMVAMMNSLFRIIEKFLFVSQLNHENNPLFRLLKTHIGETLNKKRNNQLRLFQ